MAEIPFHRSQDLKNVLEGLVGESVTLLVASGNELSGRLQVLGDSVVRVSELEGREYYDAFVAVNQVVAVVAQARGA